jgi:hypothetical protein
MVWSYATYKPYGVHQWVMCIKVNDEARSAASNGGDRVGASSFPVKGRRTWENKTRVSTGGVRGYFPPTQIGQKQAGEY